MNVKQVASLSAAFCAYYCGAAFASGQELLQFFTPFGWGGFFALALSLLLYLFLGIQVQGASHENRLRDPHDVFLHFAGKHFGRFLDYVLIFLYLCEVVMMTASAGAQFEEYFHLPDLAGRLLIAIMVTVVVLLGLDKMMEVFRFLGPIVVAFMILAGVVAIVRSPHTLAEGVQMINSQDMFRSAPVWYASAFKYVGYVMLSLIPIWAVCGAQASTRREATVSPYFQIIAIGVPFVLLLCAQLKNADLISGTQVPNLIIAQKFMPAISIGFAGATILGTFSGMVFNTWYMVRLVAEEKTWRYRIVTIALTGGGLVISGFLSFSKIIQIMSTTTFAFGIILMGLIAVRAIRRCRS